MCGWVCVCWGGANHIIFQKMFLIKPIMQLQLVAPYKHLYTAKLRTLRSQTTTRILIPDIYFCLFSLCFGGRGGGGRLHGSNFCRDETEQQSPRSSLQGESQCPPPLLPRPRGIPRTQRDGVVWWGGAAGDQRKGSQGCGGRGGGGQGVTHGRKKEERYSKHLANDLKHGNNTIEINGGGTNKAPEANGRTFSFFLWSWKRDGAAFSCVWGRGVKSFRPGSLSKEKTAREWS